MSQSVCEKCGAALDNNTICHVCGYSGSAEAVNDPLKDENSKKDMSIISAIMRANNESKWHKAINVISLVLEIVTAVISLISFAVLFVIISDIPTLFFAGHEDLDILEFITTKDWIGILCASATIPFLIYFFHAITVSFLLDNIVDTIVISSFVKKLGYGHEETLEALEKPSFNSSADKNASFDEKKKAFVSGNEQKKLLGSAYIIFPFLEKTDGRLAAVCEIIVKYCVSVFTGTFILLSFALSYPIGTLINYYIEKYVPNLGSFLALAVIWLMIIIIVPTIGTVVDKITASVRRKNLKKWIERFLENNAEK